MQLMKNRLLEKAGGDVNKLKQLVSEGKSGLGIRIETPPQADLTYTITKSKKIEKLVDLIKPPESKTAKLSNNDQTKNLIVPAFSSLSPTVFVEVNSSYNRKRKKIFKLFHFMAISRV